MIEWMPWIKLWLIFHILHCTISYEFSLQTTLFILDTKQRRKITSEVANTWANKRLISDHINRRLHINKATLYIFIRYLLFLFSTLYDFCLRNMTRKFAHFSQLLCHTTCTYWAYVKIARIIFMCSTWNSDKRHVRLWRLELHLLIFALIIPYVNYSTKKLN